MSEMCRTCSEPYQAGGDGFDGECPSCADKSLLADMVTDAKADPTVRELLKQSLLMFMNLRDVQARLKHRLSDACQNAYLVDDFTGLLEQTVAGLDGDPTDAQIDTLIEKVIA